MNYNSYIKSKNIVEHLLILLGILERETLVIEIDHTPDFNLSPYQKDSTSDYYFRNRWRIADKYEALFGFQILSTKIFHYDHIQELSKASQIQHQQNASVLLNKVLQKQPELLEEHGFEADFDQFHLRHIQLKNIDNHQRYAEYEGSFSGDDHSIDPFDWKLYAMVEVEGMTFLSGLDFYKSLVAESFSLWKEKKNKLSYFLLFAAFESFINIELDAENKEGRLRDKVNELFTIKFGELAKHQIYCSLFNQLFPFSANRNAIAHGRNRIEINEAQIKKAFVFVLTMIITYQHGCNSFAEIINIFSKPVFKSK